MPGRLVEFHAFDDARGTLVALEGERNIPFAIRRVYYLTALSARYARGFHAHRQLQQVAICLAGSCRFVLDDGRTRRDFTLDSPRIGLHMGPMVWREMHDFSPDCTLLVLASDHYSESDYIRDYAQFLAEVTGG